MSTVRYPVVELRQYTLKTGLRDTLIELFDRELVESQEAGGMAIVGQFRDLDDPDRFVWIRGFASMPERAAALSRFYGGPVWKQHAAAANATMLDSDNVLLLRPATPRSGFPDPAAPRPPAGRPAASEPASRLLVTLYYRDRPFDGEFTRALLGEPGPAPLACLQTEYAVNTFPALPVRTGEHVFASFTLFASRAQLSGHLSDNPPSPALTALTCGAPQSLRLAPTSRSLLR